MAKYMLVSFKTCPWVQRAAIVLREKNIAFEFRHIEPDNRPDWFLAISPHKKVPVLRIDDKVSLFESNAIAEYLDETIAPRLHPEDPIARAINRAWTDYVPTFAERGDRRPPMPSDEADYKAAAEKIPVPFERLEKALEKQGARAVLQRRQIFAGRRRLCAVPAALFLPRPRQAARPIEKFPRLKAWADALMARPSTHSFPEAEFEAMYRDNLKRRKMWVSQFIADAAIAAE